MKKLLTLLTIQLAVLLLTGTAAAGIVDIDAPVWRGADGTTQQQWDFVDPIPTLPPGEPSYPIMPDPGFFNPNGPVDLIYYQGATTGWQLGERPHLGVLPLSGSIQINIPNYPTQNPYKDIVIQLVWAPETPRGIPSVEVIPSRDPFAMGEFATLDYTIPLEGLWRYSRYTMHLEPNPDFEQIWISGSILVDSVIVDTICAPEPATVVLLSLGGLVLRKYKK